MVKQHEDGLGISVADYENVEKSWVCILEDLVAESSAQALNYYQQFFRAAVSFEPLLR